MFAQNIVVGYRRTARFVCPAQRWFCRPSSPTKVEGLLIWNAPPGATVFASVCGEPMAGSGDGLPALQFDPGGAFERLNKLIEWPTIDTATGIELELRSALGELIIDNDEHPDLEIILYGLQISRT
jgi:hypothetical protein